MRWLSPGAEHTLTENRNQAMPARLLAVFIVPTGAQLTTKAEPGIRSIPVPGEVAMKESEPGPAQLRLAVRVLHFNFIGEKLFPVGCEKGVKG